MSSISGEPQAAAAVKIQSHARGHLLRRRLQKTTQPETTQPEVGGVDEGEGEEDLAARVSNTSAARGDAPGVLTDDMFVGSKDVPHARTQRDAAFLYYPRVTCAND